MPDQGRPTPAHAARRIDPTGLAGAWVNTEDAPRGIARVAIERQPEGLRIGASWADERTHGGWAWSDAEALYAASASGDQAVAFTATLAAEPEPVALHANVSKGLLIISSFRPPPDPDHTGTRFAREFFRRDDSASPRPTGPPSKPPSVRPAVQPSPAWTFAGLWRNTNSEGSAIDSVSFAAAGAGRTMRVLARDASGPRDWGTADVESYVEVGAASDPARIKALYDLGAMEVLLHGWVKQGVLVLALFRRFKDGSGRSDYFDREFFYRTD
jgi:hypothetical protein